MNAKRKVPFVDTNIIPDRNAGIGSLLWDLRNPSDPDRDGTPLLEPEFAFIDVGVSRAGVSASLKTLLAGELKMDVAYVATELQDLVPYAYVTPLGSQAEKIQDCLSRMISSQGTAYEVSDWQYVVDSLGKVSTVAYSNILSGNEVWESYFMGRSFMISGEKVEFSDAVLDEMLAPDVQKIEERFDLEKKQQRDPHQPGYLWDGYRIEKNPLETGLAESGITLQKTDVPQRISDRQNVLFLGNVLNHYPKNGQAHELDRIVANMLEGDIVIVQADEMETSFIEVLRVKGQGELKKRERVRWINTRTLEIWNPVSDTGTWQQINLKPVLGKIVSHLIDCLGRKVNFPEWNQVDNKLLVRQYINQVFVTFFRALPVEETLRIAIGEALKRLPSGDVLKGIPVFRNDAKDVYGGTLGSDLIPIVSEADILNMKMTLANVERIKDDKVQPTKSENQQKIH